MPQPSSRIEAFVRMEVVRIGLEGEASHEAKLGAIFHMTIYLMLVCSWYGMCKRKQAHWRQLYRPIVKKKGQWETGK